MKKRGFTLIELLVVIAIIGLLATISVVALQASRARARDARRLSDVKQITTALALYQNDNQTFPSTITPGGALGSSTVYMGIIPNPPLPDDGCAGSTIYTYNLVSANSYTLEYCLGAANNAIPAGLNTATPAGVR